MAPAAPELPNPRLLAKYWLFDLQPARRLTRRETRRLASRMLRLDSDAPDARDIYPDGVVEFMWRLPAPVERISEVLTDALRGVGGRWRFVPFGRDCLGVECECGFGALGVRDRWSAPCWPEPSSSASADEWVAIPG